MNTVVVPEQRRDEVIQRIRHACTSGRQHDLVFIDGLHAAVHLADVSVGQGAVSLKSSALGGTSWPALIGSILNMA